MLIFKSYKKFLKIIIIIFSILNLLLVTSCTLKDSEKKNGLYFNNKKNELKTLIIPRGMNIPDKNEEYNIPYADKDLEKKDYDIFPPI